MTIEIEASPLTTEGAPVTISNMKTKTPSPVGRPRSEVLTPFGKWLDTQKMSRDAAAKELGVTRSQIDKLARGEAIPSVLVMWDISALSNGKIGLKEWVLVAMSRQKASKGSGRARRKG